MKTKFLFTALLTVFGLSVLAQAKSDSVEVLTNEKVTELYSKGLGTSIIVNKIKTSKSKFDVSTDALLKLKDEKIPDEIVNAMLDASANKENSFAIADPNNPDADHESGIYFYSTLFGKQLTEMDPTVSSQSKMGSGLGTNLTYGIAKTKMKATIDGGASRNQFTDSLPTFYFYFDKADNSLNKSGSWFSTSSSPNEFILVKMDVNRNSREFVTGSYNAYQGASYGVDDKYKVAFDIEKIRPGVYKVKPKTQLKAGEYCFMYAGNSTLAGQGNKVFDFGIK